jgi:hypothetical protein
LRGKHSAECYAGAASGGCAPSISTTCPAALKLDTVQELYSRIGWKFRRLKASDILAQPLYDNAHLLSPWAYARLSPGKIFSLETAIRQAGGALPLSSAAEIVGCKQLVYTLIVQRHVYCDLNKKVEEDTPIMMVDHAALRRRSTPILSARR